MTTKKTNPWSAKAKVKPKAENPWTKKARANSSKADDNPMVKAIRAKRGRTDNGASAEPPLKKTPKLEPLPPSAYDPPPPRNRWEERQRAAEDKQHRESDKHDFYEGGLHICHVRRRDGFWTVEVHNGNDVFVFHNKFGSWMMDLGSDGYAREPLTHVKFAIHTRYLREMDRRGFNPATGKPLPKPEEKPKAAKPRKKKDTPTKEKPKKANPWTARTQSTKTTGKRPVVKLKGK